MGIYMDLPIDSGAPYDKAIFASQRFALPAGQPRRLSSAPRPAASSNRQPPRSQYGSTQDVARAKKRGKKRGKKTWRNGEIVRKYQNVFMGFRGKLMILEWFYQS